MRIVPHLVAAAEGRCPRCGARTLFAGFLRFAHECGACGLNFVKFNVGDGPAPFIILVVGALVTGLALWLELARQPPWWVHAIVWIPLVIIATVGLLRVAKALLIGLEYRHAAVEGRLREDR